ncbi:TFIIB-type zinc ribbon-containing protein [Microlunatus soli]|uniref:Transcription factor zinc-finger domain-containing protein n=1 Tax=Microlunatus soli TaxID=630515 RepID=A0A1H1YS54_9ACTN|nr:zf-TFIIB domain-containing protein [Microlunatus soli]SDT24190.1 hypothetical protein SAMN04489812_4744 [Microlunatus soli]
MAIELSCPKCHAAMRQYERNGVTIDQCTECRGVFLDRGELDHLITAEQSWNSGGYDTGRQPGVPPQPVQPFGSRRMAGSPPSPDDYGYHQQGYDPRYRKRRKKSFLEDLFD